jgi:hypothetical protein
MLEHEHGSSAALRADAWYDYRPDRGPLRVGDRSGKAVPGAALLALKAEDLPAAVLPDLRRLMRRVIGYHLGDKPLVSSALFKRGRRNRRGQSNGTE